jgi:hypothetical protein
MDLVATMSWLVSIVLLVLLLIILFKPPWFRKK